jgi:hypothetical protein
MDDLHIASEDSPSAAPHVNPWVALLLAAAAVALVLSTSAVSDLLVG